MEGGQPHLFVVVAADFRSNQSCGDKVWKYCSLDFIIFICNLQLINLRRHRLDLLICLPLIIDFDMIIKSFPKSRLVYLERIFIRSYDLFLSISLEILSTWSLTYLKFICYLSWSKHLCYIFGSYLWNIFEICYRIIWMRFMSSEARLLSSSRIQ